MSSPRSSVLCLCVLACAAVVCAAPPTACDPQYDNAEYWDQRYVRTTAFFAQQWPKARQVYYVVGANWGWGFLEADGSRSAAAPDKDTDVIVIPEADAQKRGFRKPENPLLAGKTERIFTLRHLTVEPGAEMLFQKWVAHGNIWIKSGASVQTHYWLKCEGPGHTFLRSDMAHDGELTGARGLRTLDDIRASTRATEGLPEGTNVVRIPDAAGQWRWFPSRASKLGLSTMPEFNKTDGASVELIGQMYFNGELKIATGASVILAPDAVVFSGGFRRRHLISGSLVLLDNAYLSRFAPGEDDLFGVDVKPGGALQAGLPGRPLTRDCYVCLNTKPVSSEGQKRVPLSLAVQGDVKVHSADPTSARLVLLRDGREPGAATGQHDRPAGARGVTIDLANPQTELNGVLFDDVMTGGLRVGSAAQRKSWKNVFYGKNNVGDPDELFALLPAKDTPKTGNAEKPVEEEAGGDGTP